ncbi:MAG: hypothetical protein AVO35_12495 [Candidatus Aegiribacteria sp. MLS_C]|nr:MAG: hypothetical protein AVO35_12495 [Candidatus Aegiribacteria sp. MLS_C]
MKAYRHFIIGVTGRIELNELTRRMAERHPGISAEDSALQDAIPCRVFSPVSGGTLTVAGTEIDFRMDLYVMHHGVFMFEVAMEAEQLPEMVTGGNFMLEQVGISAGGVHSENPLMMHGWMFLFNLLDFEEVISRLGEVGSFREESQRETHDAILETALIDSCYLGDQNYLQTRRGVSESVLLVGGAGELEPPEDAVEVYRGGSVVRMIDNVFSAPEEDEGFLDLMRFLLYRENVIGVFNKTMSDWLSSVSEQSRYIRDNIGETNKVYWSRLKRRLEVWDLNFLDTFASANAVINSLESVEPAGLQPPYSETVREEYERSRKLLLRNMDSLKYSISNLRTPCEAHDEDLLQKETEKVNERIMLLSFLAMSIPLLGAVLAPGIATSTKLVAAAVLFTLPAAYAYFRRLQKKKGHRKATASYLLNQKRKLEEEIENSRKTLDGIINQEELDEKTRSQAVEFVRKTLAASEKYLGELEREIEKYD